ncbi:MAG: hydrogenase nickel incorporation protein HypB [Pirellulales bacterium]
MTRVITILREVSARARAEADEFRREMSRRRTLVVNVLSSPGAGKTSLLAATAVHWGAKRRMAVLVGDIATDRDAQRLAPLAPTVQLTTGGACHLDLELVQRGWEALPEGEVDFLFIENVGNLVCPSSHDLGEHLRVVVLSTTEGDDKPAKYPKAFRTSQALVISKIDLLPHVPFSVRAATDDARTIQPELSVWPLSALHGVGIEDWCDYLDDQRNRIFGIHGRQAANIRS